MSQDKLKIMWNTNDWTDEIDGIAFDDNGNAIKPYQKGFNNRPLVIFEVADKTYYLLIRSYKEITKKRFGEVEISKQDDKNSKLKRNSLVDTSNIHIMKTKYFKKIYSEDEYKTLYDFSCEKQFEIMSNVFKNLIKNQATMQEIKVDENLEAYSTLYVNKYQQNIIYKHQYIINKNIILLNLADWILDETNKLDSFLDEIQKDKLWYINQIFNVFNCDLKENGLTYKGFKISSQFASIDKIIKNDETIIKKLIEYNENNNASEAININKIVSYILEIIENYDDNSVATETFSEDFNTEDEISTQETAEVDDNSTNENSNVDYSEYYDGFSETEEDINANEDIQTEEKLNETEIKTEEAFEEIQEETTIFDGDDGIYNAYEEAQKTFNIEEHYMTNEEIKEKFGVDLDAYDDEDLIQDDDINVENNDDIEEETSSFKM
ncbi:Mbov_0400 family ICE element protein [Mycoplasma seminis]|uniref:Uncharacterized protein n=1 Tax=Mycoplasma seminis TaxID=512749 RepID=A0ABY9H9E7_9MOLU|nr:hypothetical protein [Mycoplasma seminis]WLP85204.1 hypothetical protein Q8852_02680 [Mycoplasma seminis]